MRSSFNTLLLVINTGNKFNVSGKGILQKNPVSQEFSYSNILQIQFSICSIITFIASKRIGSGWLDKSFSLI